MLSTPSAWASGIEASARARPRSAAISTGRRRSRSTQTPAGRPISTNGRNSMVESRPTWKVEVCRAVIAISGRASRLTWLPMRLCLDQELTNKQLAERLGKDPGTLLHHVRILVKAGFLAPGESRNGAHGAL